MNGASLMISPDAIADLMIPLPLQRIGIRPLVMQMEARRTMPHLPSAYSRVYHPFAKRAVETAVAHIEVVAVRGDHRLLPR